MIGFVIGIILTNLFLFLLTGCQHRPENQHYSRTYDLRCHVDGHKLIHYYDIERRFFTVGTIWITVAEEDGTFSHYLTKLCDWEES